MSVLAARCSAQLLTASPAGTVDEVVGHLLAVQAQDPRGARLAVRVRSSGLRAADVDAALDERRLVVTTLCRGTLHLVRAEDWPWLHALTTSQLKTSNLRRLQQEGVSETEADRGADAVEAALASSGPLRREELRAVLDSGGVRTQGQALPHVLLRASLRGTVVRGPMVEGDQAFVLVSDWLPAVSVVDVEVALGELARRYLVGHGPATAADLAKWAGVTLGSARRGLSRCSVTDLGAGLVALDDRRDSPPPPPRLMGPFDPLLLGWTSREDVIGPHVGLVTSNGIFRAFALLDGRAVATWSFARRAVAISPLEPLPAQELEALEADAQDVRRFLG